jgi:septal ring factor EnvC (AmiA/AmiB activator)
MKRRVKSIDQKLKNRVAKNRHHRRRLQNLDRRKNAKRDDPENQRRNLATHL